jgi:hypothetical protein
MKEDRVILPTLASSANNFPIISQKGFSQACLQYQMNISKTEYNHKVNK